MCRIPTITKKQMRDTRDPLRRKLMELTHKVEETSGQYQRAKDIMEQYKLRNKSMYMYDPNTSGTSNLEEINKIKNETRMNSL